jgi:hypothetical protein
MAPAPQDLDPHGPARGRRDARRSAIVGRLRRSWKALTAEQRLAVGCAAALFVTMFLPWYEKDVDALVAGRLVNRRDTLTAFGAFSFVEAAVLLVAAGIMVLFFARGEGRRFHLPGGDGVVTLAAGAWVCFLVFVRQIDKPSVQGGGDQVSATVGVHWGIFIAFLAGLALVYAGFRLREAHVAEPGEAPTRRTRRDAPRPRDHERVPRDARPRREDETAEPGSRVARGPLPDPHAAPTSVAPHHDRPAIDGGEQLSFDEQE